MTNLNDYIKINHHLTTVKEMSAETGESDDRIRKICKRYGWTPISEADRTRDMIIANPGGVVEDIAEKAGCGIANIYKLAKDLGVELVTRKQAPVKEQPKKQYYSLMHRAFNGPEAEDIKTAMDIIAGIERPKKERIREAYNQSGSPYGIADEAKNLKLNK